MTVKENMNNSVVQSPAEILKVKDRKGIRLSIVNISSTGKT